MGEFWPPRLKQPEPQPWFNAGDYDPAPAPAVDPAIAADLARGRGVQTGPPRALPPPDPSEYVECERLPRTGAVYSPSFLTAFCEAIADGETIHSLSLQPNMPSRPTLRKWMATYPEFQRAYSAAWRSRADARCDKMDSLFAGVELGTLDPDAARVVISHYRWAASKEKPDRYGEQISIAPIPPPSPAGAITLDPNNPRESERIVQSIFANLD